MDPPLRVWGLKKNEEKILKEGVKKQSNGGVLNQADFKLIGSQKKKKSVQFQWIKMLFV